MRLNVWHLVLGEIELVLLGQDGEAAQQQLQTLRNLLPHQLCKPVEVVLFLSSLRLIKVFILVISVLATLATCEWIDSSLL